MNEEERLTNQQQLERRWTRGGDVAFLLAVRQDMVQLRADFQEMLQVKEEQEEVLHHRERELTALKGALKEEVETHDSYMAALKEEYENELEKLLRDLELAKEVTGKTCTLFPKAYTLVLPLTSIVYYSVLPPRAMLCWVKTRSRQRRREERLRCS